MLPVCDALSYLQNEFGPIVDEDVLEHFQRVATTRRNRTTYYDQMRESTVNRGIAELILSQWRRYKGVRRARNESSNLLGFVQYYVQFLKWRWQIPSLTRLPSTAARKLLRRFYPSEDPNRQPD